MPHYFGYAVKPTAVTEAVKLNLYEADKPCLVLAKSTHLETFRIGEQGLDPVFDYPVYGKVACLRKLSLPTLEGRDALFVMTDDMHFFVVAYNWESNKLDTVANGHLLDPNSFPMESGPFVACDPQSRVIVMALYPGLAKVLRINGGRFSEEAHTARLDADEILSMTMLHNTANPVVALLCQQAHKRVVKLLRVTDKNELVEMVSPWSTKLSGAVPESAHLLHAVPGVKLGCMLFCSDAVVYADAHGYHAASTPGMMVQAVTNLDQNKNRFVIGDSLNGSLALLVTERTRSPRPSVINIYFEPLGETSAPSTVVHLGSDVLFVGSVTGDSQVVRVKPTEDKKNQLTVLDTIDNVGSVLDMCGMELGSFGERRLITASGAGKDGSLRVIQRGINITSSAMAEMDGIERVHVVERTPTEPSVTDRTVLALSLAGGMGFLQFEGEALAGLDVPGAPEDPALLAQTVRDEQWLFVTEKEVVLVACDTLQRVAEWRPEEGKPIGACSCNTTQAVVSVGPRVVVFSIAAQQLNVVQDKMLDAELSCVDITPAAGDEESNIMLAGTWAIDGRIYELPSLQEKHKESFAGKGCVPTSCLLTHLAGREQALFGMGDGSVFHYDINRAAWRLEGLEKAHDGRQPVSLVPCTFASGPAVVAVSNASVVFYAEEDHITFSMLNEPDLCSVASINTSAYERSLVFCTRSRLGIGEIGRINNLHISKIPLHFSPVSLTRVNRPSPSVVVAGHVDKEDGSLASALEAYDASSFDRIASLSLDAPEAVNCVVAHTFPEDDTQYFVVGTAYVDMSETQPSRGRILICELTDKQEMTIVHACETEGSVYCLAALEGHLLAGINNQVVYLRYGGSGEQSAKALSPVCARQNFGAVISLSVLDNFILVGDMLNSMFCLQLENDSLQLVGADHMSDWLSSCAMIDHTNFLSATHAHTLSMSTRELTEQGLHTFKKESQLYIGETVTSTVQETLAPRLSRALQQHNMRGFCTFGTLGGGIGCVIPLRKEEWRILAAVETRLENVVHGLGGLRHSEFRTAKDEQRISHQDAQRMVDGEFVEQFLSLAPTQQEELLLGLTVEDKDGQSKHITVDRALTLILRMKALH